ncbi:hypothetical protein PENTCL1PPCAC_21528, partial [Pristionchus entomophagus]
SKPDGVFARMAADQESERLKREGSIKEEDEESRKSLVMENTDVESIAEQIEEQTFPTAEGGIFALLSRNKCKTSIIVLLGILRGMIGPLSAVRCLFVFDTLEDEHYETVLFWLMLGTGAVGIYNFILQLVSQPICQYIGETIMNEVRVECFSSLLHRPIAYFDHEETSQPASSLILSEQPPKAMAVIDNKLAIV